MNDDILKDLLARARRIAVVGVSDREDRPSSRVAAYLRDAGYDVVPVNPRIPLALGMRTFASVADVPGPIDIVDVFRRAEETDEPIDQAIAAGAGSVWLQLGISNDLGGVRARAAGLAFVQDRCIAVEHARLLARA